MRAVCAALAALCHVAAAASSPAIVRFEPVAVLPPAGRAGGRRASGRQPLRIGFLVDSLYDPARHCVAAGQVAPTFLSAPVAARCSVADVLTTERRAVLLEEVLPRAAAVLRAALTVDRVVGPIRLGSGAGTCEGHDISPLRRGGITGADVLVFVGAGASAPETQSLIAAASVCNVLVADNRPVISAITFRARFLKWERAAAGGELRGWQQRANAKLIGVAVHELIHALGFVGGLVASTPVTIRGKPARMLVGPAVAAETRRYFGCPDARGVELEDGGSDMTRGGHFDMRVLPREVMAGSVGEDPAWLSRFALAALADFGVYTPNYGAAMPMRFGRGAGCAFLRERCPTGGGTAAPDSPWCGPEHRCTRDGRALANCVPQNLSDGCRLLLEVGGKSCDADGWTNPAKGTFGGDPATSRCFANDVTGPGGAAAGPAGCFRIRCEGPDKVHVGLAASPGSWVTCTAPGDVPVPAGSGFTGTIRCPANIADYCAADRPVNQPLFGLGGFLDPPNCPSCGQPADGASCVGCAGASRGAAAAVQWPLALAAMALLFAGLH